MPLSQRFVARRMGWLRANGEPHDFNGWKAPQALVKFGVLMPDEPLEGRGGWLGTRTFKPPEPLATDLGFTSAGEDADEGGAGVVEVAVSEPHAEVAEQPGVDWAQPAVRTTGWSQCGSRQRGVSVCSRAMPASITRLAAAKPTARNAAPWMVWRGPVIGRCASAATTTTSSSEPLSPDQRGLSGKRALAR